MIYKRYEYWSDSGKKFTDWFIWNKEWKPEFQFDSSRTINRLYNEYKIV